MIQGQDGFGKIWQTLDLGTWGRWAESRRALHDEFVKWLVSLDPPVRTVLEVGCGPCYYLRNYADVFKDKEYTGLDISRSAIRSAQETFPNRRFICEDFLMWEPEEKFDLVFSQAVIDHTHHPNDFFRHTVELADKYAFIGIYHGYHEGMTEHQNNWSDEKGCYDHLLSPDLLKRAVVGLLDESQFTIGSFCNEGAIIVNKVGSPVHAPLPA